MNIFSLFRLIVSIEAILDDARQTDDEKQQMELLLDTKKLTEIFVRELDNLIKQKMGIEVVDGE